MIRSMTGYGSAERTTDTYQIKVEFKSLNGKFLELNLRAPRNLGAKEAELRKHLTSKLVRGSVLCILTLDRTDNAQDGPKLNTSLANHYYHEISGFANSVGLPTDNILKTVVTMPDVFKTDESTIADSDWEDVMNVVNEAISKLDEFRLREGQDLREMLKSHNDTILEQLPAVETLDSERKDQVKERLENGLAQYQRDNKADENRFEQELLYYLEKMDITEEKNRLRAHCELFSKTLDGEANGKKLGFICQEMGREINTLGSKASYAPMQAVVVTMKEELEKIKEQSLNVL